MRIVEYKPKFKDVGTRVDSRYVNVELIEADGVLFRETVTPVEIPIQDSDRYTQVQSQEVGRPDLIALRMYKNPRVYWYLLSANEIINPVEELTVGKVLRVPILLGNLINAV